MIRINLLAASPRKAVRAKAPLLAGQKVTLVCGVILIATGSFLGWRYWTLDRRSDVLDTEIAAAQQETARLHSIIGQVQQFEQRRAQLQQRVALIEQLRRDQTGPVHMLDQLSRALPPMLWLTELKQGKDASEILVDGRCTTLTGLSDFVSNLESSGYFRRSVEIVSTTTETVGTPATELIKFQIKAIFQTPAVAPTLPASAPAARVGE